MAIPKRIQKNLRAATRAAIRPVAGADKNYLKQLDRIIGQLATGVKVQSLDRSKLQFGAYDFTWLLLLEDTTNNHDNQIPALILDWRAVFQSAERSAAGRNFAQTVNPAERTRLLTSTNKTFWSSLQEVRDHYKRVADARQRGRIKAAGEWLARKKGGIGDSVYRNRYLSRYAGAVNAMEATLATTRKTGAKTSTDRKVLAAGGLWRVAKSSGFTTWNIAKAVVMPNPYHVAKAVKSGVGVVNSLGGLVAGIGQMVAQQEADFRSLSARTGLDEKLSNMKQKHFGKGVIAAGDTLQAQMEEGPHRLARAADLTEDELDELLGRYRHALWWCDNWEADVREIRRDIEEADFLKHLRLIAKPTDGTLLPSELAQLDAEVKTDREKLKAEVTKLEEKIAKLRKYIGPRAQDMEELRAKVETRRSIAGQQRKALASGQAYDIQRRIANEIVSFDRSRLRSHTLSRSGQKPPSPTRPKPVFDASTLRSHKLPRKGRMPVMTPDTLESNLRNALADIRQYVAFDDDYDDADIPDSDDS